MQLTRALAGWGESRSVRSKIAVALAVAASELLDFFLICMVAVSW